MKKLDRTRMLLLLIIWFIVVSAVYYAAARLEFIWIIPIYIIIVCIAAVMFLLVNGGIAPIIKSEHKKEDDAHRRYISDKAGKRLSRRTKYKKFSISADNEEKPSASDTSGTAAEEHAEQPQRLNPLKLDDEHREFWSKLILIIGIPFFIVFLVDYLMILFDIAKV